MKKECAIIIMGVVVASMGAAATAIRRARGGGREAEPPSRDRKEKGRRRKIRTSASDSRRSACFILCLREPRAPATRTQPTRNRVGSDERDLSTPSRARTLKGARRESARGRQRKPLSPLPFFFRGQFNRRQFTESCCSPSQRARSAPSQDAPGASIESARSTRAPAQGRECSSDGSRRTATRKFKMLSAALALSAAQLGPPYRPLARLRFCLPPRRTSSTLSPSSARARLARREHRALAPRGVGRGARRGSNSTVDNEQSPRIRRPPRPGFPPPPSAPGPRAATSDN